MPKKKNPLNKKTDIKIEDISGVGGNMNIAGGDIATQ
jgi:hypothetical protein